jgi:predicted membrane-bound spermidine synthase
VGRLYAADLAGAALGCLASIPLMIWVSPPGAVMLGGAALAGAGWWGHPRRGWSSSACPALALIHLAGALLPGALPDVEPSSHKSLYRIPRLSQSGLARDFQPMIVNGALFSRWDPVFRVDVMLNTAAEELLIHHDGQVGAAFHKFDGDWSSLEPLRSDSRSLPYALGLEAPRVLIIGSAGGHEVLASLYFGARHVTGVELNPVTVSLLEGRYAEYTGHLHQDERVRIVNAEGRSFLARSQEKFDLIWLVAPDSYAAMNASTAGAFVLSESYLYTEEMIAEILDHLEPDGVLCAQFGEFDYAERPLRTARYLSTARQALERRGVEDFGDHVLVATAPDFGSFVLSTVLVGKSSFRREQIQGFLEAVRRFDGGRVEHAPAGLAEARDGPAHSVISLPRADLETWLEAYRYDVGSVSDDSPFFWHFTRLRDVLSLGGTGGSYDWEHGIGERVLLVLLGIAVAFGALVLLLPFVFLKEAWGGMPSKGRATVYFAGLGLGFMLLEVSVIQMLTLFLGYPTYSLSVTLFALLLSSGAGSFLSGRVVRRPDRALLVLGALVALLASGWALAMPAMMERLFGFSLAVRIVLACLCIMPLGLCLGMFMPLGLGAVARLGRSPQEYVAWGWAVNGFVSVIGSVLAIVLAMSFGFKVVLATATVAYLLAVAAFRPALRASLQ